MPKVLTEAHLLKLREQIADEILQIDDYRSRDSAFDVAERITQIPLLRALLVDNMADLPPERVGYLLRQMGDRETPTT